MFIDMECNSNFADGHCAQEDVSFYVHTRHFHGDDEDMLKKVKHEIEKRTHFCFDVDSLHAAEHTGERRLCLYR